LAKKVEVPFDRFVSGLFKKVHPSQQRDVVRLLAMLAWKNLMKPKRKKLNEKIIRKRKLGSEGI
jgi:hypothetical protein